MTRVLVVDDEVKITRLLAERISEEGYEVSTASSAEEALPVISSGGVDIVLCDLRLQGMDGIALLKRSREVSPSTDFVIMTAYASADTAVSAMRSGAYEYVIKPFKMDEVLMLIARIVERRELVAENAALREKVSHPEDRGRLTGASDSLRRIEDLIEKVAPTDTPVLIQGESGTGKELVAGEIHRRSTRSEKPFIVINCAALPESLLEAELFGHERGAFTGAVQKKPGLFTLAHEGTILLDEIGEMPMQLQSKLLRAIENGEFRPLGGKAPVKVDVRMLAATNRDLAKASASGGFRSDLYYRLNVFPIHIPPLRERREDIEPIAGDFLAGRGRAGRIGREVTDKLLSYDWPGNVRELRNVLERADILAGAGDIEPGHIMIPSGEAEAEGDTLASLAGKMTLDEMEKEMILLAIRKAGGNKSRAARMLGITRRTLYSRMERHGIDGDTGQG